jgi:hypothetical protein
VTGRDRPADPNPWPALVHPLPIAAIALTAMNDHVLKPGGLLPAVVTGKLSDVAGLFFFPIAVVTAARAARLHFGRRRPGDEWEPTAVALATAAVFALCKLSPAICRWLSAAVIVVPDPTDLLALPAIACAWWWVSRRRFTGTFASPAWARLVVLGSAAVTSAATQPVRGPYVYQPQPEWTVTERGAHSLACADVELWVAKSGEEGVGLTVSLRPRGNPCALRIDGIAILLSGRAPSPAAGTPQELTLSNRETLYRYFPVPLEVAASRGRWRTAWAQVDLTDAAGPHTLRFPLAYGRAAIPTWATYPHSADLPCGAHGEVLVTDTAADGVHLVLRVLASTADRLSISRVELRSGQTVVASIPEALNVTARPRDYAQVPLFLPLDAARRSTLAPRDLGVWIESACATGGPRWAWWRIVPVPAGGVK